MDENYTDSSFDSSNSAVSDSGMFDDCSSSAENYSQAMDTFSDDVSSFIDGGSDSATFSSVVDSGIDAYGAHEQMESVCGSD